MFIFFNKKKILFFYIRPQNQIFFKPFFVFVCLGFSPSPTGSFNSSSECLTKIDDNYPNSISTSDDDINNNNINTISCPSSTPPPLLKPLALNQSEQIELAQLSLRDYLQTFERRNSDSNLIKTNNQKHLSSLSSSSTLAMDNNVDNKINLFDEIKKLTDHLFKLTSQDQQQQQHEIDHNANTQNSTTEHLLMNENITDVIDIDDTLKEQPLESNINGNNSITVVEENDDEKIQHLTLDENNNDNGDTGDNESNEIIVEIQKTGVRGLLKKFMILADSPQHLSPPISESLNAPWPVSTKRTKFRINQMSSRDVPIYPTGKLTHFVKQYSNERIETSERSENHITTTTTTTFRKSSDNNDIEASTQMTKSIGLPTSPQLFEGTINKHFDMSSARKQHLLKLLDEIDQELHDLPSATTHNKANNLFHIPSVTTPATSLFENANQLKANHEAFLRNHRLLPATTESCSIDNHQAVLPDDESTVKTMKSFFQSRAQTGSVKQIQAQIEAKNK